MKALLSVIIFAAVYISIASDKVNKTIVSVLGGTLVIMLQLVSFETAVHYIDLNVIFLLVGMMTCVYILSKTGFFEWAAISVAKRSKGNPLLIMCWLLTVTAVVSAFFDNVTTIILLVPLTILIAELLEISPIPFIILETLASNIGGTATLIGDPPNIIIGSAARLSFNDFLFNLSPVIIIIFLVFLVTVYLVFRDKFSVDDSLKKRVINAIPHLAIVDMANMQKSLIMLGIIFTGFFFHSKLNIEPGIIALCGSMLMMLFCKADSEETLMKVEWGVIFFFIGMFIMIAALEANGVIEKTGQLILNTAGHDLFTVCIIVLLGSALLSAILDNIPFVITMVPLIKNFIAHFSLTLGNQNIEQVSKPLWWALALGTCLGGNMTLIGASANVVMARIAARNKYRVTFRKFLKYGVPFTLQALFISVLYIWLRYFRG
jgi:Na+/H+ antiporter NhaD/arsenite permease-like protein